MRSRLPSLLAAVALVALDPSSASAAWTASGGGGAAARAAVLAPPAGLTVTGQSCTPTASGQSSVAYRDGTTAAGTVDVVATRPALTAPGDLLLASYGIRSHAATVTAPAGWTLLRFDVYGGKNVSSGLWYRVAAADDPPTWTWSASVTGLNAVVTVAAYSGVASVGTHAAGLQGGAQVVAPSITTGTHGSRLVGVFTIHNNEVLTPAAGMSPRLTYSTPDVNGGANHQMTVQLADESWAEGGSPTGTRTAVSAGGTDSIGHLVALLPPTPAASTISHVAGSTAVGTTSFAVGVPVGVQAGDLLLVAIGKRKIPTSVTTPAGWTMLRYDAYSGSDYLQAVFWKVATTADASAPTYTWTNPDPSRGVAVLVVYRGVDQLAPLLASGGQGNANNALVTAPSLTSARENTRLVGFFGGSDGRAVAGTAAGMVSRSFGTSGSGGAEVSLEVEDQPWAPAASPTGTRTVQLSGAARAVGQLVALKPESYPLVHLSRTASPSTFTDGYQLNNAVGGTETPVVTLGPGVADWTLGDSPRLAPGTLLSLRLYARAASWWSAGSADAEATTLTTC